ncbi:MazG family protein [Cryobacterium sp. 1639]|uniref:MazG family protein n=1 Tax=Cryobacterium inferilacus TaxID=2866629 RepID=UPI001C73B4C7|nr:MazG family protein [Cryobacterium sp. 1639]MBX0299650.1 MazG family protein [Cryobacterium sp. 1639]
MTESAETTSSAAAPSAFDELVATVARLRAPSGCPWDKEQTHESLVQYLTEETHELIEAIESGSSDDLLEELGDVLYQVVFHASIAAETPGEDFDIQAVAARMTAKMVGRHPHVFGDAPLDRTIAPTTDDVIAGWDDVKAAEKPHRTSVLDGIPQGMPALALADKVIGRAQKIGLLETDPPALLPIDSEAELGPILLAIVSAAKAQGLDSERALRTALRDLQDEIRSSEQESDADPTDAGVIAFPSA